MSFAVPIGEDQRLEALFAQEAFRQLCPSSKEQGHLNFKGGVVPWSSGAPCDLGFCGVVKPVTLTVDLVVELGVGVELVGPELDHVRAWRGGFSQHLQTNTKEEKSQECPKRGFLGTPKSFVLAFQMKHLHRFHVRLG